MLRLHVVAGLGQPFSHLFRDHDGTMLSAGAAEGDCQIALAFTDIVRHQVDQQLRDSVDEFLRLWKLPNVCCDLRVLSRERAKFRNEMRQQRIVADFPNIFAVPGVLEDGYFIRHNKPVAGRMNRDGTIDSSYQTYPAGPNPVTAVLIQPDGTVLVDLISPDDGAQEFLRFDSRGIPDCEYANDP